MYRLGVPPIPNSAIRRAKLRKASPQIRAWVAAFEQFMREHDLDQPTVAVLCDTTQQAVSRWLMGQVPIQPDRQFAIEKALQLEPGSLSRHLGFVPVPPDGDT